MVKEKKLISVNFQMSPEQKEAIRILAFNDGVSQGKITRELLSIGLKKKAPGKIN